MPPKTLSDRQIKRSLRASILDGAFWAAMVGFGESFFSAFAVFLKATAFELGVLGSLPQLLGAAVQLWTTRLIIFFGNRKRLVLAGAVLQALTLIPIALLFLLPRFNVPLLIIVVCLYFIFGQIVSPAWSSWMGDLVEEERRGRYFGQRNKIIGIVTFLGLLLGGFLLQHYKNGMHAETAYLGFSLLFLLAFVARIISFLFLLSQEEPVYEPGRRRSGFLSFLKGASRTNYGMLVIFLSLMNLMVYIAAPYFAAYMLMDLQMDYLTFTIITGSSIIIKYLLMPVWGKAADKYGTRRVLAITSALMPFVPILWLFSSNVWYLLLAQAYSGFVWAGFEIASFNFLLDATKPEERASIFASYNIINGVAMFLGSMIGVLLVKYHLLFASGFLFVFLVSGLARYLVAVLFVPRLKEVRAVKHISYKELLFSVVASTHTMGFVHRLFLPEVRPALKTIDREILTPVMKSVKTPLRETEKIVEAGFYPLELVVREPNVKKTQRLRKKKKRN